jgi:hypothetical protein
MGQSTELKACHTNNMPAEAIVRVRIHHDGKDDNDGDHVDLTCTGGCRPPITIADAYCTLGPRLSELCLLLRKLGFLVDGQHDLSRTAVVAMATHQTLLFLCSVGKTVCLPLLTHCGVSLDRNTRARVFGTMPSSIRSLTGIPGLVSLVPCHAQCNR